jgi:lipopolysaccharide/colanic/teichoic acid biosynthesis glycosyltransferase
MSKNDYWNEKENEKYQKMKVGMEYEKLDFSKVKTISKISNILIKSFAILAAIIGVIAIIISILAIISIWKT